MNTDSLIPTLRDLPAGRLAARKLHLLAEIAAGDGQTGSWRQHRAPSPFLHPSFRVLLPAVGSAVVLVTLLVLAWPFTGGRSVLSQAAAAIGNGQVTHVVIDYGIGDSLVDLRTGARRPIHGRYEFWYDPSRGLLETLTFRGQTVRSYLIPPKTLRGQANWLASFVSGYKSALRSGEYHVTGSGTINGTPVYWIASKPEYDASPDNGSNGRFQNGSIYKRVTQIAIAKATYKPVYGRTQIDGHIEPGSSSHILSIETTPPKPALFANHHNPRLGDAGSTPTSPKTTLAQAQATMHRPAAIPATTIAGLHRSWIGQPPYISGVASYKDEIPGVTLYYGRLDPNNYGPPYLAPYVSITEFPHANPIVTTQGLGYFPNNERAVLENHTATLKTHGLYVIINASSPQLATAAARALVNP